MWKVEVVRPSCANKSSVPSPMGLDCVDPSRVDGAIAIMTPNWRLILIIMRTNPNRGV